MPTLDELFSYFAAHAPSNLRIVADAHRLDDPTTHQRLIAALQQHNLFDRVYVQVYNDLAQVNDMRSLPKGDLIKFAIYFQKRNVAQFNTAVSSGYIYQIDDAKGLYFDLSDSLPAGIRYVGQSNRWNNPDVDGIITDNPDVYMGIIYDDIPTVVLESPSDGRQFDLGDNIEIRARYGDSDNSIDRVDFYNDGTLLRSDTNSPYAYTWNDAPQGDHTLNARISDEGQTKTSGDVDISVSGDGPPPGDVVKIDFGALGQDLQSGWTKWSASGNDVTMSRSFSADFDANFTIRLGNVDWRIRNQVNNSLALASLIEDAVKNSSSFTVTFKGLAAATYQLTTYHHDSKEADGTLDIDVQDADGISKAINNLLQSGGTNPSNIATATFQFRSNGGSDVTMTISDNNDGGFKEAFLNGITLQQTDGNGNGGNRVEIEIEAESYTSAMGAWTQGSSGSASGGTYMFVPNRTGNDREGVGLAFQHYMEYGFSAPDDGAHYIWLRGYGNGGGGNSVWISIDGEPLNELSITRDAWGWQSVSGFSFAKNGAHSLRIHLREDNTWVDKIIITSNPQFAP
ncbi:MAG: hypothetical protein GY807_01025 [Gammaproteobacteria bacterium]|nr:hypothetical protein [Gammaproteobacteria bacterium]